MFPKSTYFLLGLILSFTQNMFSQSVKREKDSSEIYADNRVYSNEKSNSDTIHVKKIAQNYSKFEGKIIRTIHIETLDPFGYSEFDSTKVARKWAEKAGNRFHIKTNRAIIEHLLLFKKNNRLDSLIVKESERLIRAQKFIRTVYISPKLVGKDLDSLDLSIRVLDSWSIIPIIESTSEKSTLGIDEYNFLGTGHQIKSRLENRFSDGKKGVALSYVVPNIMKTFIRTTIDYNQDIFDNQSKSIDLNRPFYSPLTKWAGGIYFGQLIRKDSLQNAALVYAKQNIKLNLHDYWIGHSFPVFKGNSVNSRITNLIVTARYANITYLESPSVAYDPIRFYSDEKFILSGIGLNSRNFVKDRYLFKNGIIEDVPTGKIVGITTGYQYKNNQGRLYLGGQVSFGDYHDWGFLSTNFEMGTFFDKSNTSQTTFSLQANYFTKLLKIRKWNIRQFAKTQAIVGVNRLDSFKDQLSINEGNGIQGFNSAIYGTKKLILTLQTQGYSPGELWGFRMNPFFNYSIAKLGGPNDGFLNSKTYSRIGLGIIITNDYMGFSAFQLSISFYPSIPGVGNDIFKINSFATSDFGFQSFELARPRQVIYR